MPCIRPTCSCGRASHEHRNRTTCLIQPHLGRHVVTTPRTSDRARQRVSPPSTLIRSPATSWRRTPPSFSIASTVVSAASSSNPPASAPSREPERRRLRTPPTATRTDAAVRSAVVPVRTGEPSDAAFIVEMARLASVIEDRPLPPADDPALVRGLPPSPDTAVLALDDGWSPGRGGVVALPRPLRWSLRPTASKSPRSSSRSCPTTAAVVSVVACSTPSPPALPSTATTGWPSTSTSATPPLASTAASVSRSRARVADRSASPWSCSFPLVEPDRDKAPVAPPRTQSGSDGTAPNVVHCRGRPSPPPGTVRLRRRRAGSAPPAR